ncbi:aminotransferase class IV [Parasphingorhabdus flavimaris]|mgnify:FL=1|uniref:Probable branched-chain-amino-acid aminotransferase n=1 Tax=Parasphingorhabdus flavimaris TaxID=266812 RepID=A0ABX2N0M9_9SPHN|nr:aminotransferase class IV [Parasphingorhabdus flavimaris]NVD27275.1 aminotransferase class IV [Parasphingorhabdus flavimaris]
MDLVYLNGEYVPKSSANISIFDRGLLFSDAVYEVISVIDDRLIDMDRHVSRLERSLGELSINAFADWTAISQYLVAENKLKEGLIYLQVSRGVMDEREYRWPAPDTPPTIFAFAQERALLENPMANRGMRIITRPDLRWQRCDIKTTQLLYASLMKMEAVAAGVDDVWMTRDDMITEGTSQNAHIISSDGVLISHQLDRRILPGVTRIEMLAQASAMELMVEERAFSIDEAKNAAEAFVTSSTLLVMPVVEIDGHRIGDGKPGDQTGKIRQNYLAAVQRASSTTN